MTWETAATGKRGRQPDYVDTAIQTCLTLKVLFGMALCQTTGFVESLLHLIALDRAAPDFSTLSRPLPPSRACEHALPGNGQVNGTFTERGKLTSKRWASGTLGIRAAEFTISDLRDAPMLPKLLDQIPLDHEIARGAAAIIPPRKNANAGKADTPGAIARNKALRASERFGRAT